MQSSGPFSRGKAGSGRSRAWLINRWGCAVKRAIMVFILLLWVTGAAHGFEYHSYQPITYDDFIKMIVETSTEHGRPSLTMFKGSYRVRLTLKEYPQPLKKEEEGRFTAIPVLPKELLKKEEKKFLYPVPDLQMSLDSIMGRKVSGLFQHYSVYKFKAKVFSKTPETCAITFLWQSILVPSLQKEAKPGQTIDIYAVLLYFNGYDRQGLALVNEFTTDLAPMEIKGFTKAIEANPRDAKAYFLRGIANQEKGEYDQAIADFSKALEINPRDAQVYLKRGGAFGDKKQYDQAIADYTRALEIDPRNTEAYLARGSVYGRKGQPDEAIADFTRALEINPRDWLAYYNLGIAYNRKRQFDQAIVNFNKALEIKPMHVNSLVNRGHAYSEKGQYDLAIADYTKALANAPSSVEAYAGRAKAYLAKKEYDKSWEDVRKVKSFGYKLEPLILQVPQKASGKKE
jgi:tetratricopeptide (TPR) repeat protein